MERTGGRDTRGRISLGRDRVAGRACLNKAKLWLYRPRLWALRAQPAFPLNQPTSPLSLSVASWFTVVVTGGGLCELRVLSLKVFPSLEVPRQGLGV